MEAADLGYLSFPSADSQRVLALYQSADSGRVGPVGDTRPMDGKLLPVLGAVLEHAGGAPSFVRQLDDSKIPQWSAVVSPSSFARATDGSLYGSTITARNGVQGRPAPDGLLPFRVGAAPAPVTPPVPVSVRVPQQPTLDLGFDVASQRWGGTLGGIHINSANIVLQEVAYEPLVLPHTNNQTEGDPVLLGDGRATVLVGPARSPATWNRRGKATLTSFVGTDGVPTRLAPGPTWVLLIPVGTILSG